MKGIKKFSLVLLVWFGLLWSAAFAGGDFSYVYIQGDKKTPIYVKLEDQMMPRYGKNYCIISQLAPGPINIEILFQQNIYPPQKFVVNVPVNGFRGFLLVQKGEEFSLYDLTNKYYIPSGNSAEDDILKTDNVAQEYLRVEKEPIAKVEEKPTPKKVAQTKQPLRKMMKAVTKPVKIVKNEEPAGPMFIDDLELNSDRTVKKQNTISTDIIDEPATIAGDGVAVVNSDCPKPVNSSKFDKIYRTAGTKPGTERVKYLMEVLDNCFSTSQVNKLTNTLKSDAERFTFLKNVYSRVTDQAEFKQLENNLSTEEWKGYFRELLQ